MLVNFYKQVVKAENERKGEKKSLRDYRKNPDSKEAKKLSKDGKKIQSKLWDKAEKTLKDMAKMLKEYVEESEQKGNKQNPSLLQALSAFQNTHIKVDGKSYTFIPNPSILGELMSYQNLILSTLDETVTSINSMRHVIRQLRGVTRSVLNSFNFLTEGHVNAFLKDFENVIKKIGDEAEESIEEIIEEGKKEQEKIVESVLSDKGVPESERVVLKVMTENYQVGGYGKSKEFFPLQRLVYFLGYYFGEKNYTWVKTGKEILKNIKNGVGCERREKYVSRFKRRVNPEIGRQMGGAMPALTRRLFAGPYSEVVSQIQVSAREAVTAKNNEGLAYALSRLAYAQEAYNPEAKTAILMIKAIREVNLFDSNIRGKDLRLTGIWLQEEEQSI